MANIDQGFLGTLGIAFVALMYRAIDEGEDSTLIVAEREGRIVGFISGATSMRTVYRGMLRHWLKLGWALMPSAFRPRRVWRILEIIRYSKSAGNPGIPDAELLSLALDQGYRGQQIAEKLFTQLCAFFSDRNISAFKIVVGAKLIAAHGFYRRMGAIATDDVEVHGGSRSTVYVHRPLPLT